MQRLLRGFLATVVGASLLVGGIVVHNAIMLGRFDHIQMQMQLEPVITFAKQAYGEPVLHVRLDAAVKVPLSVWMNKDVAEVKIREAMAFTIRNTDRTELADNFSDSLMRHIKTRAQEMHGIKILDMEVSKYATAG